MVSEKFVIPSLIKLVTKEQELAHLQIVRETASEQYKELGEE